MPAGARVADVGTDHGHLPIRLLERGRIPSAIASDLREGPLSSARENALRAGVGDRMQFRLCDGLAGVAPGEADAVVIAGMGGETIRAILEAAPWTRRGGHTLILQPMTKAGALREFLYLGGYAVTAERLVRDGGRLYVVLRAAGGGEPLPRSPGVYLAGEAALHRGDPLEKEYLEMHIRRLRRALDGASRSARGDPPRAARMHEALSELNAWRKELEP
ncbi:MAG TPA: class I SAM-dependent methyltransferase [Oscillospiraceae bacterium]|nr:class I SAM-dependent methyltransferase [Oscillospiraceae bacterium]